MHHKSQMEWTVPIETRAVPEFVGLFPDPVTNLPHPPHLHSPTHQSGPPNHQMPKINVST
jgi:hypothetical protein